MCLCLFHNKLRHSNQWQRLQSICGICIFRTKMGYRPWNSCVLLEIFVCVCMCVCARMYGFVCLSVLLYLFLFFLFTRVACIISLLHSNYKMHWIHFTIEQKTSAPTPYPWYGDSEWRKHLIWFSSVPDCSSLTAVKRWSKSARRVWLASRFKWLEHSKLINNQLICPLLQNRHAPSLQHQGILKQCSSVLWPYRDAYARTHTRTHTKIHTVHTHRHTRYSHRPT